MGRVGITLPGQMPGICEFLRCAGGLMIPHWGGLLL